MSTPKVVTREEWLKHRTALLEEEKAFTRQRDALSARRRELPWVRVDKDYQFDSDTGQQSLAELFGECSQLLVYHFMFGPDWEEACTSCSFWADGYNGIQVHLKARDIALVAVSRADLSQVQQYKKRMSWGFDWVSSVGDEFSRDYHVAFTPEEMQKGEMTYNYRVTKFPASDGPGVSVFNKDNNGEVYHSYSCYSRGLDIINCAYNMMDLVPKGRDEQDLPFSMGWLRRHDQYEG